MAVSVRVALAIEIVSELTDEEFMKFVKTEQDRRNSSVKPLDFGQRIRFSATCRPKRLALATGWIHDKKYYGGSWWYKVRMDHPQGGGELFIRLSRTQLEVIDADSPVKFAGPRQGRSRQSAW